MDYIYGGIITAVIITCYNNYVIIVSKAIDHYVDIKHNIQKYINPNIYHKNTIYNHDIIIPTKIVKLDDYIITYYNNNIFWDHNHSGFIDKVHCENDKKLNISDKPEITITRGKIEDEPLFINVIKAYMNKDGFNSNIIPPMKLLNLHHNLKLIEPVLITTDNYEEFVIT